MGFVADLSGVLGYAAAVQDPAATTDEQTEASIHVARSWAGLTSQGRILISVEQLARGQDVDLLLSHETAHDVLIGRSVFGWQQLALSLFGEPPWPPGVLRRTVRRVLAVSISASVRTHEGCATFLPSLGLDGDKLTAYWANVPAEYRDLAAPLSWLRDRALPRETAQQVVFALGTFALGVRMPAERLADVQALKGFLADPAHHPDQRFARACEGLASASRAELTSLTGTDAPARTIAERWHPRATGSAAPYEPEGDAAAWAAWWQRLVAEMAAVWVVDLQLPAPERQQLLDAAEQSLLLLQPPTYSVLKAVLTRTVSARGAVWDHPPVNWLLPYELVELSYNGYPTPVPGIEKVDGTSLPLQPDDAAVWLTSSHRGNAAARLSGQELREYLARAATDTTLCAYDAAYMFPWGDTLAGEPLLRGRPHLVLMQQRSLGALLRQLGASGEVAGEQEVRYTTMGGETPGVSYFLIRPATSRYPIIVAPVPRPTALRAERELAAHGEGTLRWVATPPQDFLAGDPTASVHLLRLFSQYEDKPWPPGTTRPPGDADVIHSDAAAPTGSEQGTVTSGDAAQAAFKRGQLRKDQGDLSGAREAYESAVESGHHHYAPLAAIDLAWVLNEQGDLNGVKEAYEFAMKSGHRDAGPMAAFGLGVVRAEQGDIKAASDAYRLAMRSGHREHGPKAAFNLGSLLREQGDLAGARDAYEWAIQSGSGDVVLKAKGWLGRLLEEQGDEDGAAAAYKELIRTGDGQAAPAAALQLGRLLKRRGTPAAIQEARDLVADPRQGPAMARVLTWVLEQGLEADDPAGVNRPGFTGGLGL